MEDLREQLIEAAEIAIDNVHDMDVTHHDYAASVADAVLELLNDAVKPLEWHTREDGSMSCRGKYEITNSGGRYFPWTLTCASYPAPMYLSSGDSPEALVKVANDHNSASILAALGVKP